MYSRRDLAAMVVVGPVALAANGKGSDPGIEHYIDPRGNLICYDPITDTDQMFLAPHSTQEEVFDSLIRFRKGE